MKIKLEQSKEQLSKYIEDQLNKKIIYTLHSLVDLVLDLSLTHKLNNFFAQDIL